MLLIQLWRGSQGEEELASVVVFAGVCHGDEAAPVEAEALVDLVLEGTPVDRLPALASPRRVAALRAKVMHDSDWMTDKENIVNDSDWRKGK